MSDNLPPILTPSEEMQILLDQDVGNYMTLFEEEQQVQHYNPVFHEIFEQQLVNGANHCNGQGQFPIVQLPVQPSVLSNEEYAGPFNFEVLIDPHYGNKNPWVYSALLNKIFIGISNPFPVDFKWNADVKNLFVRATPLFSLAQHAQELVTRCIPHSMEYDVFNRSVPKEILDHVIRCQSNGAEYHGSKENKIHLSVVVPLGTPQTGTDSVRMMYSFGCKNSCPTGMNRKPFEVVFTLEDDVGRVLGRRKLSVRVCSCPKRDKEKEEKDHLKDGIKSDTLPHGKKRKIEKPEKKTTVLDTKEYTVTLRVCGKTNRDALLKNAYDLMAGDLARHGHNDAVKKCMDEINNQLKNVE